MKLINSILTKNPCYTTGKKITVKGLVLHSVGVPQPKASVFINSWNKVSFDRACVHGFIDGNDGTIYQTLPWDHRGWHGGSGSKGSVNDTHIGIELCEPDCIRYVRGATFVCSDTTKAKATVQRTYEAAVELFAYLCKKFNLNPLADGVIISHKEGHARGIASNHADPEHIWTQLDMGYTMDGFRKAVSITMTNISTEDEKPHTSENITSDGIIYKVQVGAFSVKANATKFLNNLKAKGFDAYLIQVGKYWKVQVGAFSKKSNAENMVAKLKTAGFDALITYKNEP